MAIYTVLFSIIGFANVFPDLLVHNVTYKLLPVSRGPHIVDIVGRAIRARMNNGILQIEIPKKAPSLAAGGIHK